MPATLDPSCANCGRPLPGIDAVCAHCEAELVATPMSGPHRCPACRGRFARPLETPWPLNAKWYRPQTIKPQCPHCQRFLHDRKKLPVTWIDWAIVMVLILLTQTLLLPKYVGLAAMLAIAGFHALRGWRAESRVRSGEERYALESNRETSSRR